MLREPDLRMLLSELSGKEGPDLDYDAQVWLKRLTKPRQGDMPGPLPAVQQRVKERFDPQIPPASVFQRHWTSSRRPRTRTS